MFLNKLGFKTPKAYGNKDLMVEAQGMKSAISKTKSNLNSSIKSHKQENISLLDIFE